MLQLLTQRTPVDPLKPRAMNEVRAQEKGDAEEERCRLCLGGEEDGPLVQLCACRGSARLVHRHCLEKWRRTSGKEDAAYRCGECKDYYRDVCLTGLEPQPSRL